MQGALTAMKEGVKYTMEGDSDQQASIKKSMAVDD